MLEPEGRQLLLDALRPPTGYELEHAVGTTYSLDLMSLLVAPLGFALFDREASDGRLIADPIALIEAVRRHAERIDVFCQAGQIAVPREHRAIVAYLESSVHGVVPPNPEAIFHPKVWVIRYRRAEDGLRTYRLLCLSRNLTFDRSWDTLLRMEGEAKTDGSGDSRLSEFILRLPDLCVPGGITDRRSNVIRQLADELRSVVFVPPDGFDRAAFWPLGFDPGTWPFEGRVDRLLVMSPFLTKGCLTRLAANRRSDVVVSRPEAFDLLGGSALAGLAETMVMSPTALAQETVDSDPTTGEAAITAEEAIAERAGVQLRGLHAKLYVADAPWRARLWTGSANATDAAFGGNVEFLVELEGPKRCCGIDAIVGERQAGVGLRKLLEPYRPTSDDPRQLTLAERLERRLDAVRRAVARLAFVATIRPDDKDTYHLALHISPGPDVP
ncbi:MAG: phospholipase D family protein, partial [Planctomycetes bacterium]|nr:phospholipase D family protein [Planctomycetota bacterium]